MTREWKGRPCFFIYIYCIHIYIYIHAASSCWSACASKKGRRRPACIWSNSHSSCSDTSGRFQDKGRSRRLPLHDKHVSLAYAFGREEPHAKRGKVKREGARGLHVDRACALSAAVASGTACQSCPRMCESVHNPADMLPHQNHVRIAHVNPSSVLFGAKFSD